MTLSCFDWVTSHGQPLGRVTNGPSGWRGKAFPSGESRGVWERQRGARGSIYHAHLRKAAQLDSKSAPRPQASNGMGDLHAFCARRIQDLGREAEFRREHEVPLGDPRAWCDLIADALVYGRRRLDRQSFEDMAESLGLELEQPTMRAVAARQRYHGARLCYGAIAAECGFTVAIADASEGRAPRPSAGVVCPAPVGQNDEVRSCFVLPEATVSAAIQSTLTLVARKGARYRPISSAVAGRRLEVTTEERQLLRLTTLAPTDETDADRSAWAEELAAERRARDAERKRLDRAKKGAVPRSESAASSLEQTRPWDAAGISRATWWRRRRAAQAAASVCVESSVAEPLCAEIGPLVEPAGVCETPASAPIHEPLPEGGGGDAAAAISSAQTSDRVEPSIVPIIVAGRGGGRPARPAPTLTPPPWSRSIHLARRHAARARTLGAPASLFAGLPHATAVPIPPAGLAPPSGMPT